MGCFWSSEGNSPEKCRACRRKAVNNLVIINNLCEICISNASRCGQQAASAQSRPLYGDYRCSACGRCWSSRLSWPNFYQICFRCRTHVFAHHQRQLRPSDITNTKDNVQEHRKDLCQKCQQLGKYCGYFGQIKQDQRKVY